MRIVEAESLEPDIPIVKSEMKEEATKAHDPGASENEDAAWKIHVVRQGETLYRIAKRYGTTVEAIMEANGMEDYTIHVGQRLRIPVSRETSSDGTR